MPTLVPTRSSRIGALPTADLVEDCTRLDPYARPTFRDVLLRLKSLAAIAERGREVM